MTIIKIVATYGLEKELDPRIYTQLMKAVENGLQLYKEGADSVYLLYEKEDKELGFFRTYKTKKLKKPF